MERVNAKQMIAAFSFFQKVPLEFMATALYYYYLHGHEHNTYTFYGQLLAVVRLCLPHEYECACDDDEVCMSIADCILKRRRRLSQNEREEEEAAAAEK